LPGGEWLPAPLREQSAWLLVEKAMILLLELLLGHQLLFPGAFQRAGHEPMLRFDRLLLTSGPLDVVSGSFPSLLPESV
jgi:hypothetical protein